MKNLFPVLIFIIFLTAFSSCTYVYYPTYPVVPDTKEEGAGIQATIGFTRAQLSGWYAFDSNFFVTGYFGGALSALGSSDTNSNRSYNALSAVVGAGYKIRPSDNFEFQIQGGFGVCKGHFHTSVFNDLNSTSSFLGTVDVETQSFRGFVQPSFGFLSRKGGGFYLIPRVTYESFQDVRLSSNFKNSPIKLKNKNFILTELYGLGRINAKVINIDIYAGISTNLFYQDQNTSEDSFIAQPFLFGVGVSRTFN
jgi:hypothetical protein